MTAPASPPVIADRIRDPELFQSHVLKRTLWTKQRVIARACATKRSTAVKGCHASGKTYAAAGAALHHLTIYPRGKVITIAPTLRQVKLIWQEIETARRRSQIAFPECLATGLKITEERYGIGFSSAKGINAQGFHGSDVLIITDESPGVIGEVWDAIEGIRAGGQVRLLKLGNPTIPSGPFFEDFGRNKDSVERITISAFDTQNLQNPETGAAFSIEEILSLPDSQLDMSPVPWQVSRRWVKEMYVKWGPNHPSYQSRVLGQFPTQSKFSVFPADAVYLAARPLTEQHEKDLAIYEGIIQVGIDVAGAGDDETAVCARAGQLVIRQDAWPDADARPAVGAWLSNLRRDYPRARIVVVVDVIGIGYHFATHLADKGYDVRGFYASKAPVDATAFLNAKAEAYYIAAEWMKRGIFGVLDLETQGQLIGIQYEPLNTGAIKIEDKDDAKKRGLASPDRAEALVMSFLPLVPHQQRIVYE